MLVPTRREDNDQVTKQFEGKIVSIVAARGSKRLHGQREYVQMYRILFDMPSPGKRATCETTNGAWIRRAGAVANGDYEDPPTGNWILLLDDDFDADQDMDPPEGHREGKKMEAPNSRSRTKRKSPDDGVPSGDPEDPFWVYEQEEFRWIVKAKKTDCDAMLMAYGSFCYACTVQVDETGAVAKHPTHPHEHFVGGTWCKKYGATREHGWCMHRVAAILAKRAARTENKELAQPEQLQDAPTLPVAVPVKTRPTSKQGTQGKTHMTHTHNRGPKVRHT
jgi:hypothetical protein